MIRLFFILTMSWGVIRASQPINLLSCVSSNPIWTTNSRTVKLSLHFNLTLSMLTKKIISFDKNSVIVKCAPIEPVPTPSLLLPPIQRNHSKELKFYLIKDKVGCCEYELLLEKDVKHFGLNEEEILFVKNPVEIPDTPKILSEIMFRNPKKLNYFRDYLRRLNNYITNNIQDNFSGLGIISLDIDKNQDHWISKHFDLERQKQFLIEGHNLKFLEVEYLRHSASERIEKFYYIFMEESIKLFKKLRPRATWSYYGFPICNSYTSKLGISRCNKYFSESHDNMEGIWNRTDVLIPNINIGGSLILGHTMELIDNQLDEARIIANKYNPPKKIYPIIEFELIPLPVMENYLKSLFVEMDYRGVGGIIFVLPDVECTRDKQCDLFEKFIRKSLGPAVRKTLDNNNDLVEVFREIKIHDVDGLVIWSQFTDLESKGTCYELYFYLNNTLGPLIKEMINNDDMFMNKISFHKAMQV